MKKTFALLLVGILSFGLISNCFAERPPWGVTEADGSPEIWFPWQITFPNNSVTDDGDNSVTIDFVTQDVNPIQNLWETITSDSGSTIANISTDTLTIAGQTGIDTSIAGDTVNITFDATEINSETWGDNSDVDIVWTFDGSSNDGFFAWRSANDYFQAGDNIFLGAQLIYFQDTNNYLYSSSAPGIDVVTNNGDLVMYNTDINLSNNFMNLTEIATPAAPSANDGRFYAKDAGGVTLPFWEDETPTEYQFLLDSMGAPVSSSFVTITNDARLTAERAITEGQYMDVVDGGANSTVTISHDTTEMADVTFGDASNATMAWTFSLSGANDPIWTIGDDSFDYGDANFNSVGDIRFFDSDVHIDGSSDGILQVSADSEINIGAIGTPTITIGTPGTVTIRSSGNPIVCGETVRSDTDNTDDLGATNLRWKDLYLAGNLNDDTNSISIADLQAHEDATYVLITADATLANERIIAGGAGIDYTDNGAGNSLESSFDATELDALTWSDGSLASFIWTLDVSGTDHTITFGNGLVTFSNGVTISGTTTLGTVEGAVNMSGATSLEIVNGTDPDVDAEGEIAYDTNDDALRGYDGTGQIVLGQKTKQIDVTITSPLDLAEADTLPIWRNVTGFTFNITNISADSDTDNVDFTLYELDSYDFSSPITIEAITIDADGTSVYYKDVDSGIDHTAIENNKIIAFDNDGTDEPDYIHITIKGSLDADKN